MEKTETSEYACPGEAMHAPVPAVEANTVAAATTGWKVMVAIDDSGESFYALKWAIDRLFRIHPSPAGDTPVMITLVNVQPAFRPFVYPVGPSASAVGVTPMMMESMRKAQQQNATQLLSRALQMCKENKVKAETLILEGDAKDKICEAAEELHVDLLVVGSRGLGKIKRAFLGSVSDYCAHHANCPVLIVKPPSKEPNM